MKHYSEVGRINIMFWVKVSNTLFYRTGADRSGEILRWYRYKPNPSQKNTGCQHF